jgi:chromosome partitioning protein
VRTLALCNQKGGAGKTTTTANLARAAAGRGYRTLVIDLDPQANLTSVLADDDLDDGDVSLADVLSPRASMAIRDVATPSVWDGVDLVPSGGDRLAAVATELILMTTGGPTRLRKALRDTTEDYDVVLIDCPPSLDLLAINGLSAADLAVVVTTPELFGINGIARLLTTIAHVQEDTNPGLRLAAVIANGVQHTNRMRDWLADLAHNVTVPVLHPTIQRATWIAEALECSTGLDQWGTPAATELHRVYSTYLDTILTTTQGEPHATS